MKYSSLYWSYKTPFHCMHRFLSNNFFFESLLFRIFDRLNICSMKYSRWWIMSGHSNSDHINSCSNFLCFFSWIYVLYDLFIGMPPLQNMFFFCVSVRQHIYIYVDWMSFEFEMFHFHELRYFSKQIIVMTVCTLWSRCELFLCIRLCYFSTNTSITKISNFIQ